MFSWGRNLKLFGLLLLLLCLTSQCGVKGQDPDPTGQPSSQPSSLPTSQPSSQPSGQPTSKPSVPTGNPTGQPSTAPTGQPSSLPSGQPTSVPSGGPTETPLSAPTGQPSGVPSGQPSSQPSSEPSAIPTMIPSGQPTTQPSGEPSGQPTATPSSVPSGQPSSEPSCVPSGQPSSLPSSQPSGQPTMQPTSQPTGDPSGQPTTQPSGQPSSQPSRQPTGQPTSQPTRQPSSQPTSQPTSQPSRQPSGQPTTTPTSHPTTSRPSSEPSSTPTQYPNTAPPTNLGETNHPTSSPTSQPTQYYADYKYKAYYTQYTRAKATLISDIRPDNTSVIGSIYYSTVDYKGLSIEGGCPAWNEFRTKAVNLPFDNLAPSYVKALYGTQNFESGFQGYSSVFADCADRTVLKSLFTAMRSSDTSLTYTGRCVGSDGAFHDWRVFTCSGSRPIMCIDCKFSCSDQICPGSHPTVINPCQSCETQTGQFTAMRFDIEQSPVYPALAALTTTVTTNSITVSSTLTEAAAVYCAALKYDSGGTPPQLSSIYQVRKDVSNGIGFTQKTVVDPSGTAVSVVIGGVFPNTQYRVFCYTEDASLYGMDLNAIKATAVDVTTPCCTGVSVNTPDTVISGATYDVSRFYVKLSSMPDTDVHFMLTTSLGTCSAVGTLPLITPSIIHVSAGSTVLEYSFAVADRGEGCFITKLEEAKAVYTGGVVTSYVAMTSAEYAYASGQKEFTVVAASVLPAYPTVDGVVFAPDGLSLQISFTGETDRALGFLAQHSITSGLETFDCSLLFTFTGSSSAKCMWRSDTLLRARISTQSSAAVPSIGNTLVLAASAVKAKCFASSSAATCATYPANGATQSVAIAGNDNPQVPTVSVSMAGAVGYCDDITIDLTQCSGSAGKPWNSVNWLVRASDVTNRNLTANLIHVTTHLNNFYATDAAVGGEVQIPKSVVAGSYIQGGQQVYFNYSLPIEQEIMVVLTLENHLGVSSSSSSVFRLVNETIVPNVRIAGPIIMKRSRANPVLLFASSYIPGCLDFNGSMSSEPIEVSYRWGAFRGYEFIEALPSLSKNPLVYKLDPFSLDASYRYSITIVATLIQGGRTLESEARVVIDIVPQGVKAVISGGDKRTLSMASNPIILDATSSYNMDYPDNMYQGSDQYPLLNYTWSCVEYAPTYGGLCDINGILPDSKQDKLQIFHSHENSTVQAGKTYQFTVVVTSVLDSTYYDQASTIARVIGVSGGGAVDTVLTVPVEKYNSDQKILINASISANRAVNKPVLMQWSCPELEEAGRTVSSVAITPYQGRLSFGAITTINFEFGIKANVLAQGGTYTFILTSGYQEAATDTRASTDDDILQLASYANLTTSQIVVSVNSPPAQGTFVASPATGLAFNTSFYLQANGWVDDPEDLPLTYSFSYYKRGEILDTAIISTASQLQYVYSKLGQGYLNRLYAVSCVLTVHDIYNSHASLEQAVTVNPNTFLTLQNQPLEVLSQFDSTVSAALVLSDAASIWGSVSSLIPLMNHASCSAASSCNVYNRDECSTTTDTCGECKSGFVGLSGHHNLVCQLSVQLKKFGETCSANSECFAKYCFKGVCTDPPKLCPNNCGSFQGVSSGTCVYYRGLAVGRTLPPYVPESNNTTPVIGPTNPGNGVDDDSLFVFANTSMPTSMPTEAPAVNPFTPVQNCSAHDRTCSAVCECNNGFYGTACAVSNGTYIVVRRLRENMCVGLNATLSLQDATTDVTKARFAAVTDIFSDLSLVTERALDICSRILIRTINDSPTTASDPSVIELAVKALTRVMQKGASLDPYLSADIDDALFNLAAARQWSHVVGEEPVELVTDALSMVVTKVRFGGGNNIGNMRFSLPNSGTEDLNGVGNTVVELTQRTVFDTVVAVNASGSNSSRRLTTATEDVAGTGLSAVMGISIVQHKNSQYGLETNSTPVVVKAFFFGGPQDIDYAIGNATWKVVLQNKVEIPYTSLDVEELMVTCFPHEDSYMTEARCSDNQTTTVECMGEYFYGFSRTQCPSYQETPQCLTFDGSTYLKNPGCSVASHDSLSTTCECSLTAVNDLSENDDGFRRQLSLDGSTVTFEFASLLDIQGTNFESVYEINGSQIIEKVYTDLIVSLGVAAFVICFVVGLFSFWGWDVSDVYKYDIRFNEESKVIPTVRDFQSFFTNLLPHEFHNMTMLERYWEKLWEDHDWLVMFNPTYSSHNDLRFAKWLMVMGKILNYMVAITVLLLIFYYDDGTCQSYILKDTCESGKVIDTTTQMCWYVI